MIINLGDIDLSLDSITVQPTNSQMILQIPAQKSVAKHQQIAISVSFHPDQAKIYNYSVFIPNNSTNSPLVTIAIVGKGKSLIIPEIDGGEPITSTITEDAEPLYEEPILIDDHDDNVPDNDIEQDTDVCPKSNAQCNNEIPMITLKEPEISETVSQFQSVPGLDPYLKGVTLTAEVNYHSCIGQGETIFQIKKKETTGISSYTTFCKYPFKGKDTETLSCDFTGIPKDTGVDESSEYEWLVHTSNECFDTDSGSRTFKTPKKCEMLKTNLCTPAKVVISTPVPAHLTQNVQAHDVTVNNNTVNGADVGVTIDFHTCHGEYLREFWIKERSKATFEKLCYHDGAPPSATLECIFSGVPIGSGMKPNTTYDWYVYAENECTATQSQTYSFTTGSF